MDSLGTVGQRSRRNRFSIDLIVNGGMSVVVSRILIQQMLWHARETWTNGVVRYQNLTAIS